MSNSAGFLVLQCIYSKYIGEFENQDNYNPMLSFKVSIFKVRVTVSKMQRVSYKKGLQKGWKTKIVFYYQYDSNLKFRKTLYGPNFDGDLNGKRNKHPDFPIFFPRENAIYICNFP